MTNKIEINCSAHLNTLALKGASASDIKDWDDKAESFIQYRLTDEIKDWLRSVRDIYSYCDYPFRSHTEFRMFENPAYGKKDITEEDFFFVLQTIAKKIKSKYMKTPYKGDEFGHDFGDYSLEITNMYSGVFSEDGYIYIEVGS